MGQAKQRGSRMERVVQAQTRQKESRSPRPPSSNAELMQMVSIASRLEPLLARLTTPGVIDDKVKLFAQELSDKAPIFLDCQPESWSRQSCCNLNVAEYIKIHSGQMLCGYRIWYTEQRYIEGERHAVWTDGIDIRDVSFADTGETKIVFVPDGKGFDGAPAKVRCAFEEADKEALAAYEGVMSLASITTMPDEQVWNMYPTYEDWLAGKRMPNLIPGLG